MRSNEFLTEVLNINDIDDIGRYQLEECRRELLKQPELFENTENFKKFKDFLGRFNSTTVVGDVYYPISITSIPMGGTISVSYTVSPGRLESITDRNLYFTFGKGPKPFPYNIVGDDMLQQTILCKSIAEQEEFYEWLLLSFDEEWHISRQKYAGY